MDVAQADLNQRRLYLSVKGGCRIENLKPNPSLTKENSRLPQKKEIINSFLLIHVLLLNGNFLVEFIYF